MSGPEEVVSDCDTMPAGDFQDFVFAVGVKGSSVDTSGVFRSPVKGNLAACVPNGELPP